MAGINFAPMVFNGAVGAIFKLVQGIGELKDQINGFSNDVAAWTKAWRDIQQSAFETSRAIGLNREAAMAYDRVLMQSTKELGRAYGVTYKEIAKWQEEYVERTGKAIIMNRRQQEDMAAMSRLAGADVAAQMADEMNRFGGSVEDATIQVSLIQERAKAMGLSTQAASAALAKNIRLASTYQFKNGIDGLQRMVLKSQALRVNMESITSAADKFQTIEGAIESSAKLQMLGGSFAGSFSNPMTAMYEALNDQEAFMERIRKSVAGKATFDKKTGETRISGLDQQLIKAAADAMGMSRQELTQMAMSDAKNAQVNNAIGGLGYSINDSQRALIQNKARWDVEQQKFVIDKLDYSGNKVDSIDVSQLTEKQLQELQDSNLTEEKLWGDVKEIRDILRDTFGTRAQGTTSTNENIDGFKSEIDAALAQFQNIFMGTVGSWYMNGPSMQPWDFAKGLTSWFGTFAEGGIVDSPKDTQPVKAAMGALVPGNSYTGDKVPVLANSGEMILNQQQQSGLWNTLKALGTMTAMTIGGNMLGRRMGMGNMGTMGALAAGGQMLGNSLGMPALGGMVGMGLSLKNMGRMGRMGMGMPMMSPMMPMMNPMMRMPMMNPMMGMMGMGGRMGMPVTMMNPIVNMAGNIMMNGGALGYGMDMLDMMDFRRRGRRGGGGLTRRMRNVMPKRSNWLTRAIGFDSSFRYRDIAGKYTKAENLSRYQRVGQRLGLSSKTLGRMSRPFNAVGTYARNVGTNVRQSFSNMTRSLTPKSFGGVTKSLIPKGGMLSSLGRGAKSLTRGMGPVGTVIGGLMLASEMSAANSQYDAKVKEIESSGMSDMDKAKAKDAAVKEKNASKGSSIGGLGGGLAGAAAGAAIGSVVPVVGTAIGGLIGGMIGSFGGSSIGKTIGGWFGGKNEDKLKKEKENLEKLSNDEIAYGSPKSNTMIGMAADVKGIRKAVETISPSNRYKNDIVKPATPLGSVATFVAPFINPLSVSAPTVSKPQDINVSINGNIRLDGGGSSIDLNELMKNPTFVNAITDMVVTQMYRTNGGTRNFTEETMTKHRVGRA